MRFLIALYNIETARKNLQFAAILASRLSTDLTILYVEPSVKHSLTTEMQLAREKMNEWQMESPGYKVLSEARDHLSSMGLIHHRGRVGELRQLIQIAGDHYIQIPG